MRSSYLLSCFTVIGWAIMTSFSAAAQEPEVIQLWDGIAPGSEGYDQQEKYDPREHRGKARGWVTGVSQPTLTVYAPAADQRNGTGVVICPGGGYGGLAIDHEGHVFAEWFAERGVVAAVLKYRCGGGQHQHPVPLSDAQRALRIMRARADGWQINKDRIGIAGFSAGGHLASSAGTHYDVGDAINEDPIERESCRPDFMVLTYPVITMDAEFTHKGSRQNLLGKAAQRRVARTFLQRVASHRGHLSDVSLARCGRQRSAG